jgi:hypothetical protein
MYSLIEEKAGDVQKRERGRGRYKRDVKVRRQNDNRQGEPNKLCCRSLNLIDESNVVASNLLQSFLFLLLY